MLFCQSSILPHEVGAGDAAFDWRRKESASSSESSANCMQSLFIEPVQWMQRDILSVGGKVRIFFIVYHKMFVRIRSNHFFSFE
jgi:hypothetical protein